MPCRKVPGYAEAYNPSGFTARLAYRTTARMAESVDGGIGRRAGLKHQWPRGCAGSTPAPGTIKAC